MGRWAFEGVEYATRGEMCAARRRRYAELLEAGMNFTQAARAVGVSKRTGKVWLFLVKSVFRVSSLIFFRFGAGAVLLDSSLIPSPPIMPQDRARVDDP